MIGVAISTPRGLTHPRHLNSKEEGEQESGCPWWRVTHHITHILCSSDNNDGDWAALPSRKITTSQKRSFAGRGTVQTLSTNNSFSINDRRLSAERNQYSIFLKNHASPSGKVKVIRILARDSCRLQLPPEPQSSLPRGLCVLTEAVKSCLDQSQGHRLAMKSPIPGLSSEEPEIRR